MDLKTIKWYFEHQEWMEHITSGDYEKYYDGMYSKKLPVYGDGKNVRDWLYVEDHAKAIDMVQEQGRLFETYNIGGHNEKQNIEIVKTIIDILREELTDDDPRKAHLSYDLITYVEDRKGHDRRYAKDY